MLSQPQEIVMRSYTSEFFDIRRFSKDLVSHTISNRKRLLDALMLVLTLSVMAFQIAHEITGMSLLNLCAELLDGTYDLVGKRNHL